MMHMFISYLCSPLAFSHIPQYWYSLVPHSTKTLQVDPSIILLLVLLSGYELFKCLTSSLSYGNMVTWFPCICVHNQQPPQTLLWTVNVLPSILQEYLLTVQHRNTSGNFGLSPDFGVHHEPPCPRQGTVCIYSTVQMTSLCTQFC